MSDKEAAPKPRARKKLVEKTTTPRARKPRTRTLATPFKAIGGYFVGAWEELKQVHWPNRRATWSLTFAVILFSVFFVAIILGLDTAFSYLFKEILL